jgi:hypothetical protein
MTQGCTGNYLSLWGHLESPRWEPAVTVPTDWGSNCNSIRCKLRPVNFQNKNDMLLWSQWSSRTIQPWYSTVFFFCFEGNCFHVKRGCVTLLPSVYCDMTPESQRRRSLLGNDSVNRFPRQRIRKQQLKYCWVTTMETVFSVGPDPIRCQETASADCNRLRTLVGVTVNCKVWRFAVAL